MTSKNLPKHISKGTLEDMVAQWLDTLGYTKPSDIVSVKILTEHKDIVPIHIEVKKHREVKLTNYNGA